MRTVTIKVTEEQYARLEAEAQARGVTLSSVIRESLDSGASFKRKPSLLDLMEGIAGAVDGPVDLSVNKQYMDGYGRKRVDRRRAPRRRR
jgi:hypothetical protein